MKPIQLASLVVVLSSVLLSSCNIFDPLDSPTSDAQRLSVARACFDQGDMTCANENYSKLSGTTLADQATAEQAFATLDAAGMGMGPFASALFADGTTPNMGEAINKLANNLAGKSPGETSRRDIFRAYASTRTITAAELRGFVKFVTSLALLSELLAEATGANKVLNATGDIVVNAASCLTDAAAAPGACLLSANCGKGSSVLETGSLIDESNPAAVTEADFSGASPTLYMINFAVAEIQAGLNEMGSTEGVGSSGGTFSTAVLAATLGGDSPCYRWALISQGIGQ